MKHHSTLFLFTLLTLSTVPARPILSTILLVIFSRRLMTLITLTVGETMKIRATTAGSVK